MLLRVIWKSATRFCINYNYCCVVAISISFEFMSYIFVKESMFLYFNLYPDGAGQFKAVTEGSGYI